MAAYLQASLNEHLNAPVGRTFSVEADWYWPPWCLNQRPGQLEVYVFDDEAGCGRWVPGIAQTRVVDPNGKDAYLHVQYLWDDEEYVEDFAPPRVRKVGQTLTVEDLIRSGELASRSSPTSSPSRGQAPMRDEIAEVVLECIEADHVDLRSIPAEEKSLAFQVKHAETCFLHAKIGRQHQPEFFEKLVRNKDALTSISRSHFELSWEAPWESVKLRQLSRNKLLVDSRLVTWTEAAPILVPDGTRLAFCGSTDSDVRFLVVRLTTRTRSDVDATGPHPSVKSTLQQESLGNTLPITMQIQRSPVNNVAAVLECIKASGADLSQVPPDIKAIPLELDKSVELGRNHQQRVFELLLQAEPKWLSFVSRSHCRVRLSVGQSQANGRPVHSLEVENLSGNVLFVSGTPVAKGQSLVIEEGGTIAFAAAVTGDDTKFLEFMLRRARLVNSYS